ncbi:MAG: HD domain-containing phosphohydrolase [Pseudobdellovibrionaceae bacterium]
MKKILLVEDDHYFRASLKDFLSEQYEILEAPNGKVARDIHSAINDISLILSDVQMPYLTGIDLLEWVKKNKPIPFILMTGFSHLLDTQQAFELGADDFLAKPFKQQELISKINKALGEEEPKEKVVPPPPLDLDKEFCKIPLEDFVAEKEMDYGVYIRISKFKYIKISHKGGKLSDEKIQAFRDKLVTHLYIRQEDFAKLVGFTLMVSKAVSKSSQIENTKKIHFLQYTGELIMQQAYVAGTDESLFNNAKDFLTNSLDILTQDEKTFTMLTLLSNHTDYLYSHCLGVSIFSMMIAKQLGWESSQNLFKLSFAGLFHDIGKKEIPTDILIRDRCTLTQQERKLLESHTTRGREILQSIKTAPSEVIQVCYEHHEDILGQGFPQGLAKNKIHPFTLIVSVADIFCEYTIRSPHQPAPYSAQAAIQKIKTFKEASLDPAPLKALMKIVNYQGAA